jgi:hypothetical protein
MAPTGSHRLAVLTREFRVRVLNISANGLLAATDRRMAVGTFGKLWLRVGDEEYADDIEVVRCQTIEGAGAAYHVGMRVLLTTPRHRRSIRHAIARQAAELPPITNTTLVM